MEKNNLNFTSDELLKREQLMRIKGGHTYTCQCGNADNPGRQFLVTADDTKEALDMAKMECNSIPVSCE